MKKKHDDKKSQKIPSQQLSETIRSENEIVTDILGSYTGTPKFGEKPEQDADDL